nr:tetratricopeptide repeat protein [Candidatus Sigynarchaeota archaeon]
MDEESFRLDKEAISHALAQEWDKAKECYTKLMEMDPTYIKVKIGLLETLIMLGNYEQAISLFTTEAFSSPLINYPFDFLFLGICAIILSGNPERALTYARELVRWCETDILNRNEPLSEIFSSSNRYWDYSFL